MAHQSGLNHGVGPGGPPSYSFDPRHQSDAHHQAPFQSPRPEHFPPTSPIFTGTPSLAGPVTPSCTTPPMGTTSIPRFPLRSPTLFHSDQHHTAPVSPSRNVMDPNIQLHYSFPHYRSRRASYSEESPITSTQGGTPHLPGYPGGVMAQPIANVPAYPTPNLPKHNQLKGSRRNPGLRIDFSPKKPVDGVHDNQLPNAGPYPSPILRSPNYQNLGGSLPANVSEEVRDLRRKVAEYIYQNIEVVKNRYQQSLQELFFLHIGGNIIDFLNWKRISSPQWIAFQATHKLEDDVDFVTPMAPFAPNLVHNVGNMDYIALQHKFYPSNPSAGNMSQGYGAMISQSVSPFANLPIPQIPHPSGHVSSNPVGAHIDLSSSKLFLTKDPGFGQAFSVSSRRHSSATTSTLGSLSDGRSLVFREANHSKEDIMLEARKEADILKRIAELRKEGLWSTKRLPKIQEPSRNKSHWDYVLEEMAWLATDFAQERRWKKGVAKKTVKLHTKLGKPIPDIPSAEVQDKDKKKDEPKEMTPKIPRNQQRRNRKPSTPKITFIGGSTLNTSATSATTPEAGTPTETTTPAATTTTTPQEKEGEASDAKESKFVGRFLSNGLPGFPTFGEHFTHSADVPNSW